MYETFRDRDPIALFAQPQQARSKYARASRSIPKSVDRQGRRLLGEGAARGPPLAREQHFPTRSACWSCTIHLFGEAHRAPRTGKYRLDQDADQQRCSGSAIDRHVGRKLLGRSRLPYRAGRMGVSRTTGANHTACGWHFHAAEDREMGLAESSLTLTR